MNSSTKFSLQIGLMYLSGAILLRMIYVKKEVKNGVRAIYTGFPFHKPLVQIVKINLNLNFKRNPFTRGQDNFMLICS